MYNKGRVHQSKRDIQVTKYQMSSGHSLGKKSYFQEKNKMEQILKLEKKPALIILNSSK